MKHLGMILFVVLAVMLTGCGKNEHKDLHAFKKEVESRPGQSIPALPKPKSRQAYQYTSAGQRSPFTQVVSKTNIDKNQPDLTRKKQVLEKFPLSGLRFIGALTQQKQAWGLIAAPDGNVYKVKAGDYIGENFGKILKINDTTMTIFERVRNSDGQWVKQERELKIAAGKK